MSIVFPDFDRMLITSNINTPEETKRILNHYGMCIVEDVLDVNECNYYAGEMFSAFSHITARMPIPFNISDTNTWSTIKELLPIRGMLYQWYGLGQSQFVWNLRCNHKVLNVFAHIYNTYDLGVSFDGISMSLPPEKTNIGWFNTEWWHFDQSPQNSSFQCIQGSINFFDTNEGDACFAGMIGSQNCHEYYCRSMGLNFKEDWVKIEKPEILTAIGCIPVRAYCKRGSLVLWDSRLAHYGSQPLKGRSNPNFRALVYLCYMPRSLIDENTKKKRWEIFNKLGKNGCVRMTNHWVTKPKMFPEFPHARNGILPIINPLPRPIIPENMLFLIY